MAAIFGERNFFWKIANSTLIKYPVGQKFEGNTLSRPVKGIEANLCFCVFGKNSKIQNAKNIKQATDPINLHTKFYTDELNMFPLKE